MASAKTDYTTGMASSGQTIAAQWPDLHSLLGGLVAVYMAAGRNGTEPDDELLNFIFGGGLAPQTAPDNGAWRLRESAGTFLLDERSAGAWVNRATFAVGGALTATIAAASITSGSLADARISASSVTQHATALEAAMAHDDMSGFVANEHIDHSAVSVSPGTGLTGGGTLAANRTLTLADTAVTPGTYVQANVTVDQQGRLTAAVAGSREKFKVKSAGDQAAIAAEAAITVVAPDVGQGYFFPGADGVKDYYVTASIKYLTSAGLTATFRLRVGLAGTVADAIVDVATVTHGAAEQGSITLLVRVADPTSVTAVTMTAEASAGTLTVYGGTTASKETRLQIQQASE